ncbi:hypothetical protein HF521_018096 [Silurus meridionalis]|uniref:Uncharacterized protein n=1 Tax=Silurus meridionalis TaxID=175797 RepID=A0A8T0BPM1_SILME|nr:hypothetical protein HF521_018096 [Silurus meridionalis]
MRPKRGAVGTRMRPLLNTENESQSIENKRDAVLCLIEFLGEPQEELFQDSQFHQLPDDQQVYSHRCGKATNIPPKHCVVV